MRYLTIAIAAFLLIGSTGIGQPPTQSHENCRTTTIADLELDLPSEWEGKEIAMCQF